MGQEVRFVLDRRSPLTPEEIAMIEAARLLPEEYDEDDPAASPEQYERLMKAVAERNKRLTLKRESA